jgi:hypothetical protein
MNMDIILDSIPDKQARDTAKATIDILQALEVKNNFGRICARAVLSTVRKHSSVYGACHVKTPQSALAALDDENIVLAYADNASSTTVRPKAHRLTPKNMPE